MKKIDLEFIADMFGQSKPMALELLAMFASHAKADLQQMRQLELDRNYEGIRQLAHKMKSSLLSLNFVESSAKMKELEHMTKTQEDWTMVSKNLNDALADLEEIIESIEQL